jgi:hypothetical protein
LVEDLQRVPQSALRLVSSAAPKLKDAARQAGRSIVDAASDLTDKAGDAVGDVLGQSQKSAAKATTMTVASMAALQAAERGIARFAVRRPLLLIVGGLAVAGLLLRASQKARARRARPAEDGNLDGQIGEGSYEGARDYHERTQQYLQSKGGQVTKQAREAKKALNGGEGPALEAAEEEGLRHARS